MAERSGKKRVAILGSTGSIGRSALEVIRRHRERFQVTVLTGGSNGALLAEQAAEFTPEEVVLADATALAAFSSSVWGGVCGVGMEQVIAAAARPADIVLCAIVGAAGLRPLLAAIDAGNSVAVANKEPLVMAGGLIIERARSRGVSVLPVDSEHSAIFQCLQGQPRDAVQCVHLTASGGPFYRWPRAALAEISPEQAVKHPTWEMGAKISVDSATLMNKGLEIIEAMWLFGLREEQIDVVIHPQSIVHSLVEFVDGNILAHLGVTDMKFPIQFALTYPERVQSHWGRLDLTAARELSFAAPELEEFPCLAYAREAAAAGGTAPAILNAANETAVEAFCQRRIPFLQISEVVRMTREQCAAIPEHDLESVLHADRSARVTAEACVRKVTQR